MSFLSYFGFLGAILCPLQIYGQVFEKFCFGLLFVHKARTIAVSVLQGCYFSETYSYSCSYTRFLFINPSSASIKYLVGVEYLYCVLTSEFICQRTFLIHANVCFFLCPDLEVYSTWLKLINLNILF